MGYDWDFSALWPYAGALARGTLVTVELSALSFLIGSIAGVALGAAYRLIPFAKAGLFLNDAIRAIPLLVLLFFFYYFPYAQAFGIRPPSAFVCTVLAMSLSQAVFTADLVRAAVDGVPSRAILGARALGLREATIWKYIILPDIIRQILPSLMAFYIGIVRLTSLAAVIGCEEVVFVARVAVSQRYRSLEAWTLVALIYIILIVPQMALARRLERSEWLKRRS